MSISLYDLLDVDEDATPAEIRAAWKAAIADLDPTDRRFRAYNEAAGVLLDEEKRAAYDADLAESRGGEDVEPDAVADDVSDQEPSEEPSDLESPVADEESPAGAETPSATTTGGGPATWSLLAAGFFAIVSVALLVVVLTWPGSTTDVPPSERKEHSAEAEEAGATALGVAERAVPVVLSYDYRTLDEDFAEAESYLTEDFAAQRTALFDQEADSGMTLREQVVTDKVVVTALVSVTGLTRVSEDGDRATVVVYVEQDSQKGKADPLSLKMWATLSMVAEGHDWLIDDICTEGECG